MSANLRGRREPCNRITKLTELLRNLLLCVLVFSVPGAALSAPPYDVTVTFSPPTTGGAPDGYNLYIDDCAATGPVGAGMSVTSGQKFLSALTVDGTYLLCVRAFNTEGVQPGPGAVVPVDTLMDLIPGELQSLTINIVLQGVNVQIICDSTGCVTTTN